VNEVVMASGVRTPSGNFGGTLKDVPAHKLGERVVREVITGADVDPQLIDEVVRGCGGQSSDAYNVARVIGLMAGLPIHIPPIRSRTTVPRASTRCQRVSEYST
jgi:acetyl-CoA C-acetyltransferase